MVVLLAVAPGAAAAKVGKLEVAAAAQNAEVCAVCSQYIDNTAPDTTPANITDIYSAARKSLLGRSINCLLACSSNLWPTIAVAQVGYTRQILLTYSCASRVRISHSADSREGQPPLALKFSTGRTQGLRICDNIGSYQNHSRISYSPIFLPGLFS